MAPLLIVPIFSLLLMFEDKSCFPSLVFELPMWIRILIFWIRTRSTQLCLKLCTNAHVFTVTVVLPHFYCITGRARKETFLRCCLNICRMSPPVFNDMTDISLDNETCINSLEEHRALLPTLLCIHTSTAQAELGVFQHCTHKP